MTNPEPQTVGQAVAARSQSSAVADQVRHYQDEFAQVLPSFFEPKVFTRLAVSALKRSDKLSRRAQQNPASLMHALLEAASLGLKPGTEEYYLTPRGGKEPGVLGITGYQGEIELIYRAGAVSSVKAEVVYSGTSSSSRRPTTVRTTSWTGSRRTAVRWSGRTPTRS